MSLFYYFCYKKLFVIVRLEVSNHCESVQFMQFDVERNLFIYEPGAGCSRTPRKITQGFSEEDLKFCNQIPSAGCSQQVTSLGNMFGESLASDIHRFVPKVGVSSSRLGSRLDFSYIIVNILLKSVDIYSLLVACISIFFLQTCSYLQFSA